MGHINVSSLKMSNLSNNSFTWNKRIFSVFITNVKSQLSVASKASSRSLSLFVISVKLNYSK